MTFSRSYLLPLLLLLAFAPSAFCGPAEELQALAPFFPASTKGLIYFRMPDRIDGLFQGSPLIGAERIEKHLRAAFDTFAARTGYHPLADTEWIALNLSLPEGSEVENPLLFLQGRFRLEELLPALEKDPQLRTGRITRENIDGKTVYVSQGGAAAAFVSDRLLILGDEAPLRQALASAKAGTIAFDPAPLLENFSSDRDRILVGLDVAEFATRIAAAAQNPLAAGIARKLVRVGLWMGAGSLGIGLQFSQETDAKAASDMIASIRQFGEGYLKMVGKRAEEGQTDSALAAIAPEALYGRIVSEAASEFLAELRISPAGGWLIARMPRAKVPFLEGGDGPLVMALASLALAVPAALRNRALAAQQVCFVNQHRLQAALDAYRKLNPGQSVASLSSVAGKLVKEKLLEELPADPGEGPDSFANYQLSPDGKVTCIRHGKAGSGPNLGLGGMPSRLTMPAAPSPPQTPPAGSGAASGNGSGATTPATASGGSAPEPKEETR